MIALAESLIVFLIIFIVLLQPVDVRIFGEETLNVEISLTIFSIQLNNLAQNKKKRKQKFTKKLKKILFISKIVADIINHSAVRVHSYKPFSKDIIKSNIRMIGTAVYAPLVLLYLKNSAAVYNEEYDSKHTLDIRLTFFLMVAFISLVKASYYTLKSKVKRGYTRA